MRKENITFQDCFSTVAAEYAQYRPHYPKELFSFIAQHCFAHDTAWDCATGNGQAAIALADYFQQVIATDASQQQIDQALAHPRIAYACAAAEDSGLKADSVDLVAVAQALHWFNLDAFYVEVNRLLKPNGILAVWTYANIVIDHPAIQQLVDHYYGGLLKPYWFKRRVWVEQGYRGIPFPFDEIEAPEFKVVAELNAEQLLGYLGTWSATRKYQDKTKQDPLPDLYQQVLAAWPLDSKTLSMTWPLHLRMGRSLCH